jgi:hypothetical protein
MSASETCVTFYVSCHQSGKAGDGRLFQRLPVHIWGDAVTNRTPKRTPDEDEMLAFLRSIRKPKKRSRTSEAAINGRSAKLSLPSYPPPGGTLPLVSSFRSFLTVCRRISSTSRHASSRRTAYRSGRPREALRRRIHSARKVSQQGLRKKKDPAERGVVGRAKVNLGEEVEQNATQWLSLPRGRRRC